MRNLHQKKTMLAKRKYKVRVLAQTVPASPAAPVNYTALALTVATTSTQMPVTRSATTPILVMMYKVATGQFAEVPYPTTRPQEEGHLLSHNSNPSPLEDIPSAPVREGTLGPTQGQLQKIYLRQEKTG